MKAFTRGWLKNCDLVEKILDVAIIFGLVVALSGLAYSFIVLHDPAKAAAFNPCDHLKPHKRPASCK